MCCLCLKLPKTCMAHAQARRMIYGIDVPQAVLFSGACGTDEYESDGGRTVETRKVSLEYATNLRSDFGGIHRRLCQSLGVGRSRKRAVLWNTERATTCAVGSQCVFPPVFLPDLKSTDLIQQNVSSRSTKQVNEGLNVWRRGELYKE